MKESLKKLSFYWGKTTWFLKEQLDTNKTNYFDLERREEMAKKSKISSNSKRYRPRAEKRYALKQAGDIEGLQYPPKIPTRTVSQLSGWNRLMVQEEWCKFGMLA